MRSIAVIRNVEKFPYNSINEFDNNIFRLWMLYHGHVVTEGTTRKDVINLMLYLYKYVDEDGNEVSKEQAIAKIRSSFNAHPTVLFANLDSRNDGRRLRVGFTQDDILCVALHMFEFLDEDGNEVSEEEAIAHIRSSFDDERRRLRLQLPNE
jgi:hypothetical protein